MKKQENSISSNKNRGLKYALCIITLLCCLLNTVVQAEETQYIEREYDARKVNYIRFYGYANGTGSQSWRSYTVTRDDNRSFHTAFVEYAQTGNRIEFQITSEPVRQISYDFKFYAKNSSLSTITKAFYVNSVSTANQKGIPNVQETGNTKTINGNSYKEFRIYGEHSFNTVNVNAIYIQTNIVFVSTEIYVEDFLVIINNEISYTIGEWSEKQKELEEALQDIEVTIDQNAIDDIINNPPQIDSTINVGIFNFTNETIPLYIMSLTLSLAIISFLLYGKK